jgi:formylglycine-generating enzyme
MKLLSFPFAIIALSTVALSVGCGKSDDTGGDDPDTASRVEPEGAFPGECDDGADNDYDGDYDCNDTDCEWALDCYENFTDGDCSDGADNDRDGLFDCDDPDCADDPSCAMEDDCTDGADNDLDGLFDCDDPDCAEDAACIEYEGDDAGECADEIDNDNDGLTDCDDPDCDGAPDCEEDAVPETITHPGGGDMILISAGTFDMGCTTAQQADGNCSSNESPVHSVTLTHDFFMGETEVTQGEYQAVMGSNPSYWSNCGSTCPVEYVSWHEVAEYANALSLLDGLTECFNCSDGECTTSNSPYTCDGYRLPTEAEWEYAARAGTDYVYAGSNTVGVVGWYDGNNTGSTHPVAQKLPNDWGLYDMSGNVWEWVWDWYDSGYYSSSPSSDPEGPTSGSYRVYRGGSYFSSAQYLRVSFRSYNTPTNRYYYIGLRLTRTAIP